MDPNPVYQAPQNTPAYSPPAQPVVQQTPPPPPSSGLPIGKILKIVGGVLVAVILLIFIIGFIRAHSGGKKEDVTLTYWGLWEDSSVMQPILDQFHKNNPTITVKYVKQDSNQYTDRLTTRIQNGTGPDIYRFHNSWTYFLTPYLLPLPKDVITPDLYQKTFYPVALSDATRNGGLYGVPVEIDTLSLYINSDLLEAAGAKPPVTWDDFRNLAYQMTVKDVTTNKIKTAGAAIGTFNNVAHAPDILSLLLIQSGVNPWKLSASTQTAATALTFYTSFAAKDPKDPTAVWDSTLDPSTLAFAKGTVGMYFGYSWDYFTIKAANPELRMQIVPVPYPPGGQPVTLASYWMEGVSAKTLHQKEALLFLQFLSQKETEQTLYTTESKTRAFGEPYARVDLAPSLKNNDVVYPFVQQAPNAGSSFFVDSTYGLNDSNFNARMNQYLGNAVNSMSTGNSAETAMGTLIQGVNQVLAQPVQHGQ